MLILKDISLSFGGRRLLEGINWQMKERDRVALIGGNGVGKSTLMKIIAHMMDPDKGEVIAPKNATFGYLPQDGITFKDRPLFEEVKSALSDLLLLEKQLEEMEQQLESMAEDDPRHDHLLNEYDRLSERFRHLDGYRIDAEVGRVLEGLGFKREDWMAPCHTFSGGWQMRIALARLLLTKPTVLLLDEPTNHLDIEARNWLEDYLQNYPSAILLVSHDRHFLDVVVQRCTELFLGKLEDYFGNFSYYEVEKKRRYEALAEAARRQAEEIEKLERFIERFRYKATKASQVQSRIKQLEKIERIELPPPPQKVSFTFPKPHRSGKIVLELRDIVKSYDGQRRVLDGVNYTLERGKKVALVGINGAGKSTLMRIMAGIEPFEGERELGYQVLLNYFAQDQAVVLNPDHTVLAAVEEVAPYEMIPSLRTLLGNFLFRGEDIFKKVKVLSGGERNRLALVRMLMKPANLLLLDEPTNHLDIQAKDVLLDALKRFEGTIVFVSHDRYFINELADEVLEVASSKVEQYIGNYEDFLKEKERRGEAPSHADGVHWSIASRSGEEISSSKRQISHRAKENSTERKERQQRYFEEQSLRREYEKRLRQLKKQIETLEATLEEKESELQDLESQIAQAGFYDDYEHSTATINRYQQLKNEVEEDYSRWEKLQEELSELNPSSSS